jgi:hypothetical protein
MKLIISDPYPQNGEKPFVVSMEFLECLLYYLDFGIPIPDPRVDQRTPKNALSIECPFCEGRGVFSGEYAGIRCHWCEGTGVRPSRDPYSYEKKQCLECNGRGGFNNAGGSTSCSACHGTGLQLK